MRPDARRLDASGERARRARLEEALPLAGCLFASSELAEDDDPAHHALVGEDAESRAGAPIPNWDPALPDAPSPMIRHAKAHGCPYVTGREMFEGQADALTAFLRMA